MQFIEEDEGEWGKMPPSLTLSHADWNLDFEPARGEDDADQTSFVDYQSDVGQHS